MAIEQRVEPRQLEQHFLSELIGRRVVSARGTVLGGLLDLVVDLDFPEPQVTKLVYRRRWSRDRLCFPWTDIGEIGVSTITLKTEASMPVPVEMAPSEILLRDFLLDKQIVDINGAKVERVNDLQFLRSNGKLIIVQVDVGLKGLLRRLGFETPVARFLSWFFDYTLKDRFIAWSFAQPLADPDRLRLQIPQSSLASLHPADLADIIEDMDVHERAAVAESLDEEVIAEALEEMDPKVQVSIVKGLDPHKAADIIEQMSADEAVDLIADLPAETVNEIFDAMDDDYEEKLRGLLEHEEDEAGGLMSTQYITLAPDKTIVDALAFIKQNASEMDVIYYIYVVDDQERLVGVVNLRELLSAEIFTPLGTIMQKRVITAKIDEEAEEIADLFGKYGFRAIPVVDEESRICGVIRFKAMLEVLAPQLRQ
jgi:CBS domain-containing protein/sporulation protein YlmC with PRC-barrel domain